MGRHEQIRDYVQSKEVNCANVSLMAINQGVLPENSADVDAITKGTSQIEMIGVCAALDMYYRKEAVCVIHTMPADTTAAEFLTELHQEAVADPEGAYFFGGLVRMRYLFVDSGDTADHVVAVTEIDAEAKTATVVDVSSQLIGHDLITRVPFEKLNQMVIKEGGFSGGRVVGLTGLPFDHSLVSQNRELISTWVDQWQQAMKRMVKHQADRV